MNIEVLAPVGSYNIAKEVLKTDCDAIYLGGIEFNMRMHSKLLNFTNEEIEKTVLKAHALKKLVYVTVNTWFDETEIDLMKEYLIYLDKINVDAIIVQDLGVINLVNQLNLNIEIHASVMLNVHNIDEVKALEAIGVTRVVLSREMPLDKVKEISENTNCEIEYFVSGDMCTINGGLCYASGIMFNKSANRGQCFKMCRWNYTLKHNGNVYENGYFLAAKDMDMISHIDSLIEAGVNSLKIEGRRKPLDQTKDLINIYAQTVSKYKTNDYNGQDYKGKLDYMYPRDTTSAYAFGNPGLDFINSKNEGNPNVLRIFSKKGKELTFTENKIKSIKQVLEPINNKTSITVKVDNEQDALIALQNKVDYLYLSLESFKDKMSIEQMQNIIDNKKSTKIYLSMPMMQSRLSKVDEHNYVSQLNKLDGLEVSDYGQIIKYRDKFDIKLNFTFNIMNSQAVEFLINSGASSFMPSIEANPIQFNHLNKILGVTKDIISFGRLTTMYSDLDLYENTKVKKIIRQEDNKNFPNNILVLENETGQENPVFVDCYNKNHIQSSKILNLLPLFDQIKGNNLIIDARTITLKEYELALNTLKCLIKGEKIENELLNKKSKNFFLGSFNHIHKGAKYVIVK